MVEGRGAPAEPGAHRAGGGSGLPPAKRVGIRDRPGHSSTRGEAQPPRGHPVGKGRREPETVARGHAGDRIITPESVVGATRLFRVAPVQQGERAAPKAGRAAGGLDAQVIWLRNVKGSAGCWRKNTSSGGGCPVT